MRYIKTLFLKGYKRIQCVFGIHEWEIIHPNHVVLERRICKACGKRQRQRICILIEEKWKDDKIEYIFGVKNSIPDYVNIKESKKQYDEIYAEKVLGRL